MQMYKLITKPHEHKDSLKTENTIFSQPHSMSGNKLQVHSKTPAIPQNGLCISVSDSGWVSH